MDASAIDFCCKSAIDFCCLLCVVAVEIRVGRAIMIASIVFSSLAALVAISGLRCTRCLEEDEKLKDRAAFLGGILSVCSGEFKIIEQITNKLLPETGVFLFIFYPIKNSFFS